MIPTLLHIGPFPIHSFGLLVVLACVAAWRALFISLRDSGRDPALAEKMVTWAALGGILGARLGFLISFPNEVMARPLETIFSSAGFVFHWGFVGGILAVWYLLRREGESFLLLSDLVGPALSIGYGVGRIGCQLSGDGDYGMPTDLPWAMGYPLGVVPTPPGVLVHPTPVYESIGAMLIAFILLSPTVKRRLKIPGQQFGLYLLLTASARFLVEYLRIEPVVLPPFTQAQVVSIILATVGLVMIFKSKLLAPKSE